MLSDKIEDKKMTNKDAFNLFDINKNGTLDKQELLDGLNTFGIHMG
jgi:Ca2+-binding EF-hand superfamily protein